MPRPVVPILRTPLSRSLSLSIARWCGRMRWARAGNDEPAVDVDPPGRKRVHLLQQGDWIDHHAAPDHTPGLRPEDARRDQVQDERVPVEDHRVAGVVPALIPGHDVRLSGQDVDDLSFPFVSPLPADDDEAPASLDFIHA